MPQVLSCPNCQRRLSVPSDNLRRLFRCGACDHSFTAEDAAAETVEPIAEAPVPAADEDVPTLEAAPEEPEEIPTLEEWPTRPRPRRQRPEPEVRPGCFSYGLALSPLLIPVLAIPFCRFGTGWLGAVVWAALGLGLALACAGVVRRTQWGMTGRVLGSLGLAGVGHLLLVAALGFSFWQWRNTIDPHEWRDFAPPGGRFHVSVPGVPVPAPAAARDIPGYQTYQLELPRQDIAFGIGFGDVPLAEWNQKPLQVRFDESLNGILANVPGSRLVSQKRITRDHNPGREFHLHIPDRAEIVARVYFVRNRVHVLLIAGSRLNPDSEYVTKFLDSFRPDPLDEKEFPPLRPDQQPPDIEDEDIHPGRRILGRAEPEVMQLVVSRDGGTLATACADGTIDLWGLPGGERRGELRVADRMPQLQHNWLRLALSPDGTTLAAGTRAGDLKLFDAGTQKEVATLLAGTGQFAPIDCLAFSPDGLHLATGHRTSAQGPGEVRLWDVPARQLVRPIRGQKGDVTALAFAPDGRFLLCGDTSGAIRWLDPLAGGETKRFEVPTPPGGQTNVTALAFTADGGTLVSSHYDHTTRLWDVRTGKDRVCLRLPVAVVVLDVTPNGRFLTTGTFHGQLLISEAGTGNKRWEQAGMDLNHIVPGPCLAFTPDGRRFAVVRQKRVELWDLDQMIRATPEELAPPKERPAPAAEPVREPEPEAPPARIEAHVTKDANAPHGVFGMGLTDGGKTLVTAGRDRGLRFWDLANGKKKAEAAVGVSLAGMAVSPDGKLVAVAVPSTVYLYDARTAQMIDTLTPDAAAVVEAGMPPDVREAVKRINKGEMPRPSPDAARIGALAFGPDGETLAVSYPGDRSGVVELWDVPARKVRKRFVTEPGADKLAVSAEGKTLALGRDNHDEVRLYDVPTGAALTQLRGLGWGITALAYSADGKYLAASGGGPAPKALLLVWDAATGRELHRSTDHENRIVALAFSPDGRSLASAGQDGMVRVYDTASGQSIGTFAAHAGCLLFSHDGKRLFAGGNDGWVDVWGVANLPRPKPPEPVAEPKAPGRQLAFGKDLQRAGHVEPFLAAAVDPKAGRTLFLGHDRFLRVYSYPDFRPQKAYWLGAKAYRATLDLAHGRLYAAVCDDLALRIERGGRIHGPADLQVFDVKQILAGEDVPGYALKPIAVIRRQGEITQLFATPDGRWVYYLDAGDLRNTRLGRIDTATHKPKRAVDVPNLTGGACLSRDGKTLYVGRTVEKANVAPQHWGGEIRMFDADTLANRGSIEVPSPPRQIAADDDLVYFGGQGPLGVVDLRPAKPTVAARWDGHWFGGIFRVGAAPRRLYVIQQAIPTTIRAFNTPDDLLRAKDNNAPPNPVDEISDGGGDGSLLGDILVTPDGKYLLSRAGVVVRLAVPGMNRPLPPPPAEDKPAPAEVKGLPLRERDAIPARGPGAVQAVAISPDGKMIAAGDSRGAVSVYDRPGGALLGWAPTEAGIAYLAFNPKSQKLLSTSFDRRGQVRVTRKGTSIGGAAGFFQNVGGHGLDSIAVMPDGREAAGAGGEQGKQVVFWLAENGREGKKVSGFPDPLTAVALSPDGKLLAAGSTAGPVRQVNVANPRQTRTLTGHTAEVRCVAYSPDGKLLASAGVDGTVRLWDPDAGKEPRVLRGHTHVVLCLAFSPDGKALVTGGADGTMRWWDPETGAERGVVPPRRPGAMVYALAFAPDGKELVAACGAEVRRWDVGE